MPTRSGRIQNSNLDRPRSPGGGRHPGIPFPTGQASGGFRIRPGPPRRPSRVRDSDSDRAGFKSVRPDPRSELGLHSGTGAGCRSGSRYSYVGPPSADWSGSKFGLGPASVSSPARPPENLISDRICGQARVGFEPDRTGRGWVSNPTNSNSDRHRSSGARPTRTGPVPNPTGDSDASVSPVGFRKFGTGSDQGRFEIRTESGPGRGPGG